MSIDNFEHFSKEEAQLVSAIKFHYSSTLSQIPLEAALFAIAQAWGLYHVDVPLYDGTLLDSGETLVLRTPGEGSCLN